MSSTVLPFASSAVAVRPPRLPALTPVEARHAWDAGATVVDVRPATDRCTDPLPGALTLAPDQLLGLDLSAESTVILVCVDGERSRRLAGSLHRQGIDNATSVLGGYRAWRQRVWRQYAELLLCSPGEPATRFLRLIGP